MSNRRNPKRDESKKLYLESRGELKPKDIAEKLGVSPSLVRKWKSQDKWDDLLNGNITPDDSSNGNGNGNEEPKRYVAPKGNQHAKGNKGNTKPKTGNKNAVKHGLYETISFDYLSKEEKDLVMDMVNDEYDPLRNVNETIAELRIRQRRMMRRIQELEEGLSEVERLSIYRLRTNDDIKIEDGNVYKVNGEDLKEVERHDTSFRKVTDILAIEEALTKVTDSLLRAIKTRNDIELDNTVKFKNATLKNRKLEKELEMLDAGDEEDKPLQIEILRASRESDGE